MNLGYVSPEDFQHFRVVDSTSPCSKKNDKENDSMLILIIIAVVAFLVVVTVGSKPECRQRLRQIPAMISTMRTRFSKNDGKVSSKISQSEELDEYVKHVSKKCRNLTACLQGDVNCKDFKNVSEEYKKRKTNEVKEYLQSHQNIMILIYAPWCPHCHTALPQFMEAADELEDVDVAILNAEMVDRKLMGDLEVTHFPFIAKSKDGLLHKEVFKGRPQRKELVDFCKAVVTAPKKEQPSELDLMFM